MCSAPSCKTCCHHLPVSADAAENTLIFSSRWELIAAKMLVILAIESSTISLDWFKGKSAGNYDCSNEIRGFPMNFPYTNPMTYYTRSCLSIIPLWNSRQKSSCPLVDITASHPSSELSILNWLIHNTCYNAGIVGIRVMRWDGICSAFIYIYIFNYILAFHNACV